MIPAYTCIALRIWIRLKRKAWGNDDWCMVAAIVCAYGVWCSYILLMMGAILATFHCAHRVTTRDVIHRSRGERRGPWKRESESGPLGIIAQVYFLSFLRS